MSHRLTGIRVNRISFVDKAAVRDPNDPSQPRRFLLTKAENERQDHMTGSSIGGSEDATTTTASGIPADEQQKLDAVLILLRDCEHPQAAALYNKVDSIVNPNAEVRAVAKFNGRVEELRKSDPKITRTEAMERVRKDDPKLQRELHDALRGVAA